MTMQRLEPEAARMLLDSGQGYSYLDVRTEEEFRAGHVPGAVNIPFLVRNPSGAGLLPNLDFLAEVEKRFPRDAHLILGCQRGTRSSRAAEVLASSGFHQVQDMRGGFEGEVDPTGAITYPGWRGRGLPVSTD